MTTPSPLVSHQIHATGGGGATVAVLRLGKALEKIGVAPFFWHNEGISHPVGFQHGAMYQAKPHRWIYNWRTKRQEAKYRDIPGNIRGFFYLPWSRNHPVFESRFFGNGILHLHSLGPDLLDYETFFGSVPDSHPIIWTLHDINPVTGGCGLARDCTRYSQNCGRCPWLSHPSENDVTRRAWETKARALRGKNLHFVTPSHWLRQKVEASSIGQLAKSIRTIHNPLDTGTFAPLPSREDAKRLLGITDSAPIIAFGAEFLKFAHKGMRELIAALLELKKTTAFQLVVFGQALPDELVNSGIPYKHVGFVGHQPFLRMIYCAADVYVLPSLEDNSPQTGIEALACGTPVVAFATGGIPDFVKHGETGWLAQRGNTAELALHLKDALSNPPRLGLLGENARKLAVALFAEEPQARKYLALYEEACAIAHATRA